MYRQYLPSIDACGAGGGLIVEDKVEFASSAWLELATQVLQDLVREAGASIAGERLTICESFYAAPDHLRLPGSDAFAWSIVIDDKTVEVFKGARESGYVVRADYQSPLPRAREIIGSDAAMNEARAQARQEAINAGKIEQKGSLDSVSPPMRQ